MVMREWPFPGDGSVFAAKAALAARNQGLDQEFRWALMGMRGHARGSALCHGRIAPGKGG
jgi:hypothetical protein